MIFLTMLIGCTPLEGDWEGEVDCGDYAMNVTLTLAWGGQRYEGEGVLDCTDAYGADCTQTFDLQVDAERSLNGGRELDVDVDDCRAELDGYSSQVSCDNPDDVEWDGGDRIDGEWGDCDVDLFRE